MKIAIFADGNKFVEAEFKSEEDCERVVRENFKTLFGAKTIFFDVKGRVESKTLGATIPDGFLFVFRDEENPEFYLVEVELQQHDFYKHIFPQITKFFAFFKNAASRNNLIERLFSFIKSSPELEQEFKQYLGKKEIYKALKDIIDNSQNILLILDGEKSELEEVFETYTDTWDKMVKVEILKQYINNNGKIIYTLTPDFEEIPFGQPAVISEAEEEQVYTESYHLEGVDEKIISIYEQIKNAILSFDSKIKVNPQKYYISLRKTKNFAYIMLTKSKMHIVLMLPYETGKGLIKKHKISMLSPGIQAWYGAPCFRVTLENAENLDEIINALKETYKLFGA
jgi:predicted transport protein